MDKAIRQTARDEYGPITEGYRPGQGQPIQKGYAPDDISQSEEQARPPPPRGGSSAAKPARK